MGNRQEKRLFSLPMSLWFGLNAKYRNRKSFEGEVIMCAESMTGSGVAGR